jgi:hypothetical protein
MADDDTWSPPDSDFSAAKWTPPESDFSNPYDPNKPAIGDDLVNQIHAAGSGLYHGVVGGYKGLAKLVTSRDPGAAADVVNDETAKAYKYTPPTRTFPDSMGPQTRAAMEDAETLPSTTALGDFASEHGASPGWSAALAAAPTALSVMAAPRGLGPEVPAPSAQAVADQAAARQSTGAAGAAPDVSKASPELQQAIASADPEKLNPVSLKNHLQADSHGVQLMKGQANRDPIQFSEEQNQSTHPIIAKRLNDQNMQMTDAIDNIRREASPTNVSNNATENGQSVVDALKDYDEPVQADIRAKYKALTDANGGSLPIDPGSFLSNVDASLKKGYLTKTAAATPEISEILDSVRAGEPMDFESFENARTRLAAAQRGGGSPGEAARIVRGQLEQMPLSPQAANLKDIADQARSAAKARFDSLEQDPAYQAAVDDVSGGIKKGTPSPLADTFLDKYAVSKSAPKSQVDLMMSKLHPDAQGAVVSHTLNTLRKSAINAKGDVLPAGYNNVVKKFDETGKLSSLLDPNTEDSVRSLGDVINNAKAAPPGSSIAPKSGVIVRDALHGAVENAASAVFPKTMGAYGVLKKVMPKNGFANEATAPGAGLEHEGLIQRPTRASGGKVVSHEELVDRLMRKWKAAKKATDATTKPLLGVSDNSIARALEISGNAL